MTSETVVVSRYRAWWRLLWLLGGLVTVALLLCIWWYFSTADLAGVREAAKRQGLPVTIEEWNRQLSPASQRASIERLGILSKSLKDFDSELTLKKIPGDSKRDRLRPFLPIQPAAREFHAVLDQTAVAEALALLDQLPRERIVRYNGDERQRPKDTIGLYRQTTRWLSERILLATDDQAVIEVQRALRLVLTFDVARDIDQLVQNSLISIVATSIAARLPALQPHHAELDSALARIEGRLPDDVRRGLVGSFIDELRLVQEPDYVRAITIDIFGSGDPPPWWDTYLNPLRLRAGRAAALGRYLTREGDLRQHHLEQGYIAAVKQRQHAEEALRTWHPGEWLPKRSGMFHASVDQFAVVAQMHLRLLRAQLRGESWPEDPYDPSGRRLRELSRDGQVIGAYSLGENQHDDGGDRNKDRTFLLFGPYDPPLARPAEGSAGDGSP